MKQEQQPQPGTFEFSKRERLFYRIRDERFRELISLVDTSFHEIVLDINSYGEFLFASVGWQSAAGAELVTFWGLGYHEYRERWIGREWFWYRSERRGLLEQRIPREQFLQQLEERAAFVRPYLGVETPSRRGQLFELLADMSDEDGAMADLEEFHQWLDDLDEE